MNGDVHIATRYRLPFRQLWQASPQARWDSDTILPTLLRAATVCDGKDDDSVVVDAVVDDIREVAERCGTHAFRNLPIHLWHPGDALDLISDRIGEAITQSFQMPLVLRVGRDDVVLSAGEIDDFRAHDLRPNRASISSHVRTSAGFAR